MDAKTDKFDLSIIVCAAGRTELYREHLAALLENDLADVQYCVSVWGDDSAHRQMLAEMGDAFAEVRIVSVPNDRYFMLPQAYNCSLVMADAPRVLIVGSDVLVPPETTRWALRQDCTKTAWFTRVSGHPSGKLMMWPEKFGAFPYCTAIDRADLLAINGWDSAFSDGVVFDDIDWGLRLLKSGVRFRWDWDIHVLHHDHPRTHGADRQEHKMYNKELAAKRLRTLNINRIWPCGWRELYYDQLCPMPEGDGIPEQDALAQKLIEVDY